MFPSRLRHACRTAGAAMLLIISVACAPVSRLGALLAGGPGDGELPFVPEGAAMVERHREAFTADPNNALLRHSEPFAADDLSELEGCWGAFQSYEEDDGGALTASQARFVRFDVHKGQLTFQVISRGGPMYDVDIAVEDLYQFTISSRDAITITPFGTTFATDQLPGPFTFEPSAEAAQEEARVIQVTVDGDMLRFWDEGEGPFDSRFVYFRIDECP